MLCSKLNYPTFACLTLFIAMCSACIAHAESTSIEPTIVHGSHVQGIDFTGVLGHRAYYFRAFIPGNVSGARPVPKSDSDTMISFSYGDTIVGCFGTDNRDFKRDTEASSRFWISISTYGSARTTSASFGCGKTTKYDCNTGEVQATGFCDPKDVKVSFEQPSEGVNRFTIDVAVSNPLVPSIFSPDIDLEVKIEEDYNEGDPLITVRGLVDAFPAFEGYYHEVFPTKLFHIGPVPEATPLSLIGGPSRPVNATMNTQP